MKRIVLLGLLVSATWACSSSRGGDPVGETTEALQCSAGETALYSKVAPPSAGQDGASGIGAAPAVLAGSGSGNGSTTPGTGESTSSSAPFASTSASCVPAVCPAGKVAVPKVGTGSASSETGVEGPSDGTPTTSGVGTGETPSSGPAVPATSSSSPSPAPTPPTVTASEVICTSPPPACPSGQAPSYAPAGFWHCLPLCNPEDSSLVVISYGSTYGNGGVCAGPPPLFMCATPGDVWTWNYLTEAWQCEPKCDNGQYDQRSYEGEIVCVPC